MSASEFVLVLRLENVFGIYITVHLIKVEDTSHAMRCKQLHSLADAL